MGKSVSMLPHRVSLRLACPRAGGGPEGLIIGEVLRSRAGRGRRKTVGPYIRYQ